MKRTGSKTTSGGTAPPPSTPGAEPEVTFNNPMLEGLNAAKAQAELLLLERRDGVIKPEAVVEYAQEHPRSELHKAFDWNDKTAAHKHRLAVARSIIHSVVITYPEAGRPPRIERVFTRPPEVGGYQNVRRVAMSKAVSQEVIKRALRDLKSWCERFNSLLSSLPLAQTSAQGLVEVLTQSIDRELKEDDAAE